ncbi:Hsp70 family protein [Aspergillus homomorphus CBS 101889]|uniref:Actin-like ATPase domain-containing protein n=1 Tax=Aspergillus homomorphus (strain CBS 101889) TaxID=1450537 RepID=A0A395I4X4_ASPHC|nr:actin-like ATPase domain-containing protein [Aspergillus homomorphus CBS 101889]RAL15262.1 actin-like ATPase domain-containing protein [Aspergillus homomorphus CBS 101889]
MATHKVIVAIDYGTTYTGVSYVSSSGTDLKDVKHICSWPGPSKGSEIVFKTPSRVAYPADNPKLQTLKWGYEIEPGMIAYAWTKLLLDAGTALTEYDDSTLENASQTGILRLPPRSTAVDVVADYLSQIYQFILQTLVKQITEETLKITPIEFWFTVPAIWSDKAKDATRTAAQRAGFACDPRRKEDKIFLISEPEAAAITALEKYTTGDLANLVKVDDGVLICDCGGGTVDLTTFLVTQISPKLTFEELCTGIGGKCGSSAIDREFYRLMSRRFGAAFDLLKPKSKGPGSYLMNKFEIIKRGFGLSHQAMFELPLNMKLEKVDPRYYDEEERVVFLYDDDLRGMFNPVVDKIVSLVHQQIEEVRRERGKDIVNRIILVGGFGDSEYLRQTLERSFGQTGQISITVPDYPQAAIVQGAALSGLRGLKPSSRKCRRYYGFQCGLPFRPGIDAEADSYIEKWSGAKYAGRRIIWMISKGETYTGNTTLNEDVMRDYSHPESLTYSFRLYACDKRDAPDKINQDAYPVGEIITDLSGVGLSQFKAKYFQGKRIYRLEYSVTVTIGAQEGVLKFEALAKGQTIGKTSVRFETT